MYKFTSESVTSGHPDKICDCISDAILDACLEQDKNSRVACEVSVTHGFVLLFGEITTNAKVDYERIARETIKNIGYDNPEYKFDFQNATILNKIQSQSPDIAQGINANSYNENLGAGDQGLMFGYATNETVELLPITILLSHKLAKRLEDVRKNKIIDFLRPDGKTQVTTNWINGKVDSIDTILISTQHDSGIPKNTIQSEVKKHVVDFVLKEYQDFLNDNTKIYINETNESESKFVLGGPAADSGLTGRKIIVDTYGGSAPHGGGAFSGKDPTKVDRSAAYMARYVTKNLVAAGICEKALLQLSYGFGLVEPISIMVDTFGTSKYTNEQITEVVKKVFKFTPFEIIHQLDLRTPRYKLTSAYGHFTNQDLPWEITDKVIQLKKEIENV